MPEVDAINFELQCPIYKFALQPTQPNLLIYNTIYKESPSPTQDQYSVENKDNFVELKMLQKLGGFYCLVLRSTMPFLRLFLVN